MSYKYKRVYLTEKNSQVSSIAEVENAKMSGICAYNNEKGIAIVPLQGHVLINESPKKYAEEFDRFNENSLEKFPRRLRLVPNSSLKAKYENAISHLKDAEEIVIATDFDNEGAAIALNIIEKAKAEKRVTFMLEMGSTHPDELRHAIDNPIDIPYKNMAEAGRMRAWIDFVEGMYLSRALSIYLGNNYTVKLNYGGVKAPLSYIVVERDLAYENHKKEYYWVAKGVVEFNGKNFNVELQHSVEEIDKKGKPKNIWTSRFNTEEEVIETYKNLINKELPVSGIKKDIKQIIPPKLYELTGLQAEMGIKPVDSMALAQKNYDNPVSIQSYPRTEIPYLKSGEYSDVKTILTKLRDHGVIKQEIIDSILSGTIPKRKSTFNDKEVVAHGAIVPTKSGNYKKWLSSLPSLNKKMFELVAKRYTAQFMQDYKYKRVVGEAKISDELKLVFSENIPLEAGWKKIYDDKIEKTIKDYKQEIPEELKNGDKIKIISFSNTKNETRPKPEFTMESLLMAMKNIASLFPDNKEIKEFLGESGIGTPATRSQIIAEVMSVEKNDGEPMLIEKGKKIKSTEKARNFVSALPIDLISPIKRAVLTKKLKKIEKGELKYEELAEEYLQETKNNIELIKEIANTRGFIKGADKKKEVKSLGKCPLCKEGDIVESKKIFYCTNAKYKKVDGKFTNEGCKYTIFKNSCSRFGKNNITATEVKKLLSKGKVMVSLKSSKTGKAYNKEMVINKKYGVNINF